MPYVVLIRDDNRNVFALAEMDGKLISFDYHTDVVRYVYKINTYLKKEMGFMRTWSYWLEAKTFYYQTEADITKYLVFPLELKKLKCDNAGTAFALKLCSGVNTTHIFEISSFYINATMFDKIKNEARQV